tara:strand:- start:4256 stop:4771 length:516 start_codon:yes stop_codon:yes gene_type:complete
MEKLSFPANVAVEGLALFNGVRHFPEKDGMSEGWGFSMTVDGVEKRKICTRALAEKLTGVKEGDNVKIMKEDPGTGASDIRWRVKVNDEEVESGPPLPQSEAPAAAPVTTTNKDYGEIRRGLKTCIEDASRDWQDAFGQQAGEETVQKLATALFIEANRVGVQIGEEEIAF